MILITRTWVLTSLVTVLCTITAPCGSTLQRRTLLSSLSYEEPSPCSQSSKVRVPTTATLRRYLVVCNIIVFIRNHHRIMYAYVRFVEDGANLTVPVSDIKKFDIDEMEKYSQSQKFKVKFTDGRFYKAHIVSFGETPEDAKARGTQKRFRIPKRMSESETSESDTTFSSQELSELPPMKHKTNLKACSSQEPAELATMKPMTNLRKVALHNMKMISDQNDSNNNISTKRNQDDDSLMPKTNRKDAKDETIQKLLLDLKKKDNEILSLKRQLNEITILNRDLQKEVIDKFKDFRTNEIPNRNDNFDNVNQDLEVAIRRDGNVHVSKGIWLPQQVFDSTYRRKKDTIFIKELAKAIFGEETLAKSSISGIRRDDGRPGLDPTKILAIQDILRYRCRERGYSKPQEEKALSSVDKVLNEKIQDLRRAPRQKKNATVQNTTMQDPQAGPSNQGNEEHETEQYEENENKEYQEDNSNVYIVNSQGDLYQEDLQLNESLVTYITKI